MPVRRYCFIMLVRSAIAALLMLASQLAQAQQVVLTTNRGIDFGSFVASSGGSVTVSPAGLRSRTGAVVLLNSPGVGQASFTVSRGSSKKTVVVISLPSDNTVRLSSGTNSMAVNNFVSTPATTMSIPTPGTLSVGASLIVAANQAPGAYSGTFNITVNFQ